MPLRDLYADARPVRNDASARLCVVLPAYNEEKSVAHVIRRIRDHLVFPGTVEIIVVDDGSSDMTSQAAAEASARVIRHRRNEGLGVTIATGVEAALRDGADIIVTMDSDGQFKGEHISEIIAPILAGQAEMVIGSRYLRPDFFPPDIPRWKMFLSNMLCALVSHVIWGKKLTDVTCGFRAYTRNAAVRLNFLTRFTYTVESIIDASAKGLLIAEVPVRAKGNREHGKSRITSSFLRYLREIGFIILRRMRDSRPLLFFLSLAVVFIIAGIGTTSLVSLLWPFEASRVDAVITAAMCVTIVAVLTTASLLADQVLTSMRYLHSLMRMARVNQYEMMDLKEGLLLGPVEQEILEPMRTRVVAPENLRTARAEEPSEETETAEASTGSN